MKMKNYYLGIKFFQEGIYSSLTQIEEHLLKEHIFEDFETIKKIIITGANSRPRYTQIYVAPPVKKISIRELPKDQQKILREMKMEELVLGFYPEHSYLEINLLNQPYISFSEKDLTIPSKLGKKIEEPWVQDLTKDTSLEYILKGRTSWNVITRISLIPK